MPVTRNTPSAGWALHRVNAAAADRVVFVIVPRFTYRALE